MLQDFIKKAIKDQLKRTIDDAIPESVDFKVVPIISNSTLEETVHGNTYAFIAYFHPDDDSSKQIAPRLDTFAREIIAEGLGVVIQAIDCQFYEEACTKKEIKYYPSLMLYVNEIEVEFPKSTKLPQSSDLVTFVRKRVTADLIEIIDVSNIEKTAIVVYAE